MAKYILKKPQIKRLIEGKPVTDGYGLKYVVGPKVKELLQMINDHDLYDEFSVIIENGGIDIVQKNKN